MGRRQRAPPVAVPAPRQEPRPPLSPGSANQGALSAGNSTPGSLVEIGEGWWKATPSDGARPYYWHRKNDVRQFEPPTMRLAVLNKKLLAAADDRDAALVQELVSMGADVDAADPSGTTCVMKAVLNDDIQCLSALVGGSGPAPDLELRNALGRSALHIASFWGRIGRGSDSGILGALMRAGCDVGAIVSGSGGDAGCTAISLACVGIVGSADTAKGGSPLTPRTPPATPRTPGTPRTLPDKADVELLLRIGPDAFEEQKQAQLDAAKAKRDEAKRRAMAAALSKARKKKDFLAIPGQAKTTHQYEGPSESERLAQEKLLHEKLRAQEELKMLREAAAAQRAAAAEEKRRQQEIQAERAAAAARIQATLRGKKSRLAHRVELLKRLMVRTVHT